VALLDFDVTDRFRHLVLVRFEEICEHEHGAIEQPREKPNYGQEADEGWHYGLRPGLFLIGLPFFAPVVKDALKA
jgi:hypothetical protein